MLFRSGAGLEQWNGAFWSTINANVPTSMTAAAGSLLYANYGAAGLFQWNGTAWSQINANAPTSMLSGF